MQFIASEPNLHSIHQAMKVFRLYLFTRELNPHNESSDSEEKIAPISYHHDLHWNREGVLS